jgi:hypothetical protein
MKITPLENELLWALRDMVLQHCSDNKTGRVESGFLSANAYAMRLLVEHGYMEDVRDVPTTRWIDGVLIDAGRTPHAFGLEVEQRKDGQ